MTAAPDRLTRVHELLKREIADYIQRELGGGSSFVSVTEVRASSDLREASVKLSIFGGDAGAKEAMLEAVRTRRIEIQRKIARELAFKHTPVLHFVLDERIARGDRVLDILNRTDSKE